MTSVAANLNRNSYDKAKEIKMKTILENLGNLCCQNLILDKIFYVMQLGHVGGIIWSTVSQSTVVPFSPNSWFCAPYNKIRLNKLFIFLERFAIVMLSVLLYFKIPRISFLISSVLHCIKSHFSECFFLSIRIILLIIIVVNLLTCSWSFTSLSFFSTHIFSLFSLLFRYHFPPSSSLIFFFVVWT